MAVPARAGILVLRVSGDLQFAEAAAVTINGKAKALNLGEQPESKTPFSKLPSVHLTEILLRDGDTGVVAQYESGKASFLVPEGLPKTAPASAATVWKDARISYKKTPSDKVPTDVPPADFVAFLPGGKDELTRLCTDPTALQVIGGKGKAFAAQMQLLPAVARNYGTAPEMAPLEKYVEDAMRSRYDAFESAGDVTALQQGLTYASLSQAAYAQNPGQEKLRGQLRDRKAWLDRKIAVLKAFSAGAQWDQFLRGSVEFERFYKAFPDLAAQHSAALEQSLALHSAAGLTRQQQGDFGGAHREFQLAALRKPSDSALHDRIMQAWTEYSRRIAMEQQPKRAKLAAGPQSSIERDLYFAEQNKAARKLDEALKNVQDAESMLRDAAPAGAVSTETLKVLFAKADLLAAQDRVAEAMAALDAYDLLAVDEERLPANKLRNQLLFSLDTSLKSAKASLQAAWDAGNFGLAAQIAAQGLKMSPADPDLLFYAGISALVRRQTQQGRELLARYLRVSDTLDGNSAQRLQASRIAAAASLSLPAQEGEPNWLSGWKLSKGLFYCPISLAFQPHIDRIDASNKLHETFEWAGEKLKSVTPSYDKSEAGAEESKISFAYDDRVPQVFWAGESNQTPVVPTEPDELYKRALVVLLNQPTVDPLTVERATGKNPAMVIAGNRFFNPFVWQQLCYFRLTYDDRGRVSRAQQLNGPRGAPGDQVLEFEWNSLQLVAIRGYVGKVKNYERTMQYQGGRLVSEEIQGEGKSSHIKYTYAGNRLVSAEAGADATLDNRSRKVTFVQNSPSTLVP